MELFRGWFLLTDQLPAGEVGTLAQGHHRLGSIRRIFAAKGTMFMFAPVTTGYLPHAGFVLLALLLL
jgi:hypothetical protein